MKLRVTQYRVYKTDTVTISNVEVEECNFKILELPWRNNARMTSCIPVGLYRLKKHSPTKVNRSVGINYAWELYNVPDRSEILIHVGNSVDDIEGCLAIGLSSDYKKEWIKHSKTAVKVLYAILDKYDEIEWEIVDATEGLRQP